MKIPADLTRRTMLQGAAAALTLTMPGVLRAAGPHIVIVGGGFGGAAAARSAKAMMPSARVTLLSDQARYWLCPGSNGVIAGLRSLADIEVGYDGLMRLGIEVGIDPATAIDPAAHVVVTQGGMRLRYDKLILSPGIQLNYDAIEGLSEADQDRIPHAWKAGPQTALLARQLSEMRRGGLFVMTLPRAPYRCPPAPAERACLVAHYLKAHNPGARLLILDAKDDFPFLDLFTEAWTALYADIIEYRSVADDGLVRAVDPARRRVVTDFAEIAADVLNVIPPQTAGRIAATAGATDATGWCPVDVATFQSSLLEDVYVIGDAALVDALPKAGSTAASQARVAVAAALASLTGTPAPVPTWVANCYSLAAPGYGIRLGAKYALDGDHVIRTETDFSTLGGDAAAHAADAQVAQKWFDRIRRDIWG